MSVSSSSFHNLPACSARHVGSIAWLAAILVAVGVGIVHAADMNPGLVISFGRLGASTARDSRLARMPALYVPDGESPTPFVDRGRFRAVWEGFLEVEFIDDYTFSVEGRGAVRLEIDGKVVLEGSDEASLANLGQRTIELEDGWRPFMLRYESPPRGDAVVRLFWSSFDFTREPVNPAALRHDPRHAGLVAGARLRRGRNLLASRQCLACHIAPADASGMPELSEKGPSLEGIGGRLNATWMARWIADPRSLRADARMPAVLADDADAARDVAAFLATLRSGKATDTALPAADRDRGATLFDTIGCAACHVTTATDEAAASWADARLSLATVPVKWKPAALVEFLLAPSRHYPSIRMPDSRLSRTEARSLAAFLLGLDGLKPPAVDMGDADIERGRRLVQESGCLGCHESSIENTHKAPALGKDVASLGGGCLAAGNARRRGAPDFALTGGERDALRAFLKSGVRSLGRRNAIEYAQRQFKRQRCRACHTIDGQTALWSNLVGAADEAGPADQEWPEASESDLLLQRQPRLTWTGEKMRPEWLAAVITGTMKEPLRPWLRARMPGFAVDGQLLARGLALAHGRSPAAEALAKVDATKAAIGKQLMMSKSEGFACHACHDVAGVRAEGAFDQKGVDFIHTARRLRHEYYHRWMLNPTRLEPGTKMPTFSDRGKTAFTEVYDGDARKQFEAIWHHLIQLSNEAKKKDGTR